MPLPLNIPNLVTLSRIILIPLLIGIYYLPEGTLSEESKNITATSIFIFAGITDWLDGYLARRLNQMSAFGAFLDPVADKLIVVGALVVLLHLQPPRVDALVALIIIGREIAISALREWMAKVGQAKSVAVAFVGKLKTVSQMVAIPLLLYHDRLLGLDCFWLGTILINVAAVLTVASMLYYLRKALPYASVRD
jgi:cardiolipin synthase